MWLWGEVKGLQHGAACLRIVPHSGIEYFCVLFPFDCKYDTGYDWRFHADGFS